jgi:hypothetical protein
MRSYWLTALVVGALAVPAVGAYSAAPPASGAAARKTSATSGTKKAPEQKASKPATSGKRAISSKAAPSTKPASKTPASAKTATARKAATPSRTGSPSPRSAPAASKSAASTKAAKTPSAAPKPATTTAAQPAKPKPPAPALIGPMAFTPKEIDLAPGETYPVELFVPSPTGKATEGRLAFMAPDGLHVTPDARWTGRIPAWGVKTFPKITAAPEAEGDLELLGGLEEGGRATLTVHIVRPAVEPVPGVFKLTVRVTNPFRTRVMSGRIRAENNDRFLQDVTTREFKILPGRTQDVIFPLPGAAPVESEAYDFALTVETYQGFKEKKTYPLKFPSHTGRD